MQGPTVHGNLNYWTADPAVQSSNQRAAPAYSKNSKLIENIVVIISIALPLFLFLGAIGFCVAAYIISNALLLTGALACALTAIIFIGGLCCSYTSHENAYREEFNEYPEDAPLPFDNRQSGVHKMRLFEI